MINRQQGFTLLEVMAALAIFSMLSVLAFMIFSQASELHQRSQKEIQQFNQLQRTITILDNDLLQLVVWGSDQFWTECEQPGRTCKP